MHFGRALLAPPVGGVLVPPRFSALPGASIDPARVCVATAEWRAGKRRCPCWFLKRRSFSTSWRTRFAANP